MSGPDPSNPVPSATNILRLSNEDASFEANLADLAARFAAESGGGLSLELSSELALEIVLNEVVEQACLATGATGAAIVLWRDGELVCRASNGTAPELGARLSVSSGLTGECIRTWSTQRCDDVVADPRADIEASYRLGVRSVIVMPLVRGAEFVGIFELFSASPAAFGERDELTMGALAQRILANLNDASMRSRNESQVTIEPVPETVERAWETFEVPPEAVEPAQEIVRIEPTMAAVVPTRRPDYVTVALAVAVLACAVLLGLLLGRHFGQNATRQKTRPAESPLATTAAKANSIQPTNVSHPEKAPGIATPPATTAKRNSVRSVPPGGLLILENGKEVFRMQPSDTSAEPIGAGVQKASAVEPEKLLELSPDVAENSVLHRVEPEYPEEARQQRIQGTVVLDIRISSDGLVQGIQVVSGPPQLVAAARDAVKQWRFRPRGVAGHLSEMQTRINLNFSLPK